eukprot:12754469-Alexandrium_andersonii.AAC.1
MPCLYSPQSTRTVFAQILNFPFALGRKDAHGSSPPTCTPPTGPKVETAAEKDVGGTKRQETTTKRLSGSAPASSGWKIRRSPNILAGGP